MRRCLLVAAALCGAPGFTAAQELTPPDPYTGHQPAAMERLGYRSFGPFPWGDDHDSRDIEALLGQVRIRWVETAHFRLGSALSRRELPPDSRSRRVLYGELERLHDKLPRVQERPGALDPWLLTHLYAQRVEELYGDLSERLGVTAADFQGGAAGGPHLGCRGPFLVLLLEGQSDLARYLGRYAQGGAPRPTFHYFRGADSLLFATAAECQEGRLWGDNALRAQVTAAVVRNLLEGYLVVDDGIPLWWQVGVAHWYCRRADARTNGFVDFRPDYPTQFDQWEWEPKVRGRVRHGIAPPVADLFCWYAPQKLGLVEHMMAWSRVEFLMARDADGFARFTRRCKEQPMRSRMMPPRLVLDWHREAFAEVFGMTLDEFEAAWRRHVLTRYDKR